MSASQKKIDLLNNLNDELRKKNKFLTYNPLNDTIIVNEIIAFPCEPIMKGNYGREVKEISKRIDKITSNMFYGWENIKNGKVPKECKLEKIMPALFSVLEVDNSILSFAQLMAQNTNNRDDETVRLYKPQVLANDQYGGLGVMFLYTLGEISFPLTEKQFEILRNNMNFDKFMDKIVAKARTNFMREIETIPKENKLVNNCYLWNLKNMSARSVIFGAEIFHKYLIQMTGFYADRIYLYPINETGIALFHGLIDGNDMIDQINLLRQNDRSSIDLEVFEINPNYTTTIRFRPVEQFNPGRGGEA